MNRFSGLTFMALLLAAGPSAVSLAVESPTEQERLQGNRVIIGTVEEVKAGQIKVDTGDVHPRFLPLREAKEKDLAPIKKGDKIEITVNDQNLIVDYHRLGEPGQHQVVRGQIAEPLVIGHDQVLIQTEDGVKKEYEIRSQARSKMASIPTGVDAVFLLDETNKIVDVTLPSSEAVGQATESVEKKSPIKGAQRKIEGTVVAPLEANRITIRTEDGREDTYEARPLIQDKLAGLSKGEMVVLMLDSENKIIDAATVPTPSTGGS